MPPLLLFYTSDTQILYCLLPFGIVERELHSRGGIDGAEGFFFCPKKELGFKCPKVKVWTQTKSVRPFIGSIHLHLGLTNFVTAQCCL